VDYHNIISKALYALLFIFGVLSFRKHQVRFQLEQYLWVMLALALVVFQLKYAFKLIYSGMFWYVLSLLLVITNDIMAYVCGMSTGKKIFGERVFLDISPNKTWEGFIGGGIFTVIASPFVAGMLQSFEWMRCPGQMTMVIHPQLNCATPAAFEPGSIKLPLVGVFTHAQWHALCLGIVASIVAPFGGFLASAIKRAYDIKDFADLIPGHGGVMDRIDCQLLMIFCTSTYLRAFVWDEFSADQVVHLFSLLSVADKQRALELIQKVPIKM
jgi:phosphatidate cytidylyltransferase